MAKPPRQRLVHAGSSGQNARKKRANGLTREEAIRLFVARATDAGAQVDARRDLRIIGLIVDLVSCDRVGVQLAASRARDTSLTDLHEALGVLRDTDAAALELRARLQHGEALRNAGKLAEAARALSEVIRDAARDPHARAEAHRHLGSVARAQGRPEEALVHKEAAVKLFAALDDRAHLALAEGEVGVALVALGRLREARARHEKAVAAHRDLGSRREEGVELSYLGVTLHRLGLFAEARRAHEAALAIHHEMGHTRLSGAERMHLGYVAHEALDLTLAREHLDAAAAIFRNVSDRALLGVALSLSGALAVEDGRLEDSGALLAQALSLNEEAKSPRHEAMTRLYLSYHHAELGEHALATASLARALALGRGAVEAEHEAWMLALSGRGAEAARISIEDPCTVEACALLAIRDAVLAGKLDAASAKAKLPAPRAKGSRVRRAGLLLAAAIGARAQVLSIAADAAFFVSEDGQRVDLQRKTSLRKALALLLAERQRAPGVGVAWERVLAAGWPDQRIQPDAAFARVRNALFQLRKLGIGHALVTGDHGYFLDPRVTVRVVGG